MPFDLCKIGQLLKSEREKKGLAYEEVSTALFIRRRVIEAIEAGNWDVLPHPVYVRGYVTQYASFLKIQDEIEAVINPVTAAPVSAQSAEPSEMMVSDSIAVTESHTKGRTPARAWEPKKKIIGAVAMGAVVVGFFVFQNLPKPVYVATSMPGTENGNQAVAATTVATPAPTGQATPSAEALPYQAVEASASDAVTINANSGQQTGAAAYDKQEERLTLETKKLTIACQERTWVRIIIDRTEKKEFMLNPEEVVMLNAREGFDVIIGNAAGVKLIYNGKEVGFSGQSGEVRHINLS
jgi:cytoskeleton protein RodZ